MSEISPLDDDKGHSFRGSLRTPKDWEAALTEFESEGGVFLLIGATDTGKSTFCKLMIRKWCEAGRSVALVDCDVGQSMLGPPTTVGLKLFSSEAAPPESLCDLNPPFMRFVGSTSPQGHLLQTITATKMIVDRAKTLPADATLVDTTGMIRGGAAFQLKTHKMELIEPNCVVAFQRHCEAEHIILSYERQGKNAVRLRTPEAAKVRDSAERKLYREDKFREYFARPAKLTLSLEAVATLGCGVTPDRWTGLVEQEAKNLLVGLTEASGITLALGIIEQLSLEDRTMEVHTPLSDSSGIAAVHFGCLKVAKNGSVLGRSRGLSLLIQGAGSRDA